MCSASPITRWKHNEHSHHLYSQCVMLCAMSLYLSLYLYLGVCVLSSNTGFSMHVPLMPLRMLQHMNWFVFVSANRQRLTHSTYGLSLVHILYRIVLRNDGFAQRNNSHSNIRQRKRERGREKQTERERIRGTIEKKKKISLVQSNHVRFKQIHF